MLKINGTTDLRKIIDRIHGISSPETDSGVQGSLLPPANTEASTTRGRFLAKTPFADAAAIALLVVSLFWAMGS
jgi:hypothetical protein